MHKAILSKVPYFNATVGGGFKVQMHFGSLHKRSNVVNANEATKKKESVQEKITIEELFEPFEIQWLLSYIYFPRKPINRPNLLPESGLSSFFCIEAPSQDSG